MQDKTISVPPGRNFALMVLGQVISILGAALLRFALSLYVLDTTGSEALFATLYAISSIPLLLAPLGGAIADRFNRRNLMVIFDFTSSAITLCLVLAMGLGGVSVFLIGAVMVLLSLVSALYTPAVTASVPLLVASDKLESSNGIVQVVQSLSGIAAPILGGFLYGAFNVQTLVIVSSIAFFLSAVMEIFIRIPFVKREQEGHMIGTIAKDLKEGFAFVVKDPFIFKSMTLAALLNLVLSPLFIVGIPIILRVTMQSSDKMYGVGMGLVEFAMILGALAVGFFAKRMKMKTLYRWILMLALLLIPIAMSVAPFMLGMGYIPSFSLFILCVIPIAATLSILSIFVITRVQKKTPNENLGKVMAILIGVTQCAAPLGQMIYGVLFKHYSTTLYIPILAVSLVMIILSGFTRRILKNED